MRAQLSLISIIAGLLLSSCSSYKPACYRSLTFNVPLMKNQFDSRFDLTGGANHAEMQTSFAPLKHWAWMGQVYFSSDAYQTTYETGAGYFTNFKDKKYTLEVYGLFTHSENDSWGESSLNKYHEAYEVKANYQGGSIQCNAGVRTSVYGSFAVSTRYNFMHYKDFYYKEEKYEHDTSYPFSRDTFYLHNPDQQFLEFALTYKNGWKNLRFFGQISFHSVVDYHSTLNTKDLYTPVLLSSGVSLYFDGNVFK